MFFSHQRVNLTLRAANNVFISKWFICFSHIFIMAGFLVSIWILKYFLRWECRKSNFLRNSSKLATFVKKNQRIRLFSTRNYNIGLTESFLDSLLFTVELYNLLLLLSAKHYNAGPNFLTKVSRRHQGHKIKLLFYLKQCQSLFRNLVQLGFRTWVDWNSLNVFWQTSYCSLI